MPRWVPNLISVTRILLVPVWVVAAEVVARGTATDRGWVLVAILLALGLSDIVDGFIARRFDLATNLGATLDAVADKLAQVVMITYLALRPTEAFSSVPIWFLAILIARDGLLLGGWVLIWRRHGKVANEHKFHGKMASVLLFVLVLAILLGLPPLYVQWLCVGTALWILGSTADYVRIGWHQYRAPSNNGAAPG
jgi:phosphatidylglycerophosphate synthase